MKRGVKILFSILTGALICGLFFDLSANASSPSIYISPSSGSYKAGDSFTITIGVNPGGVSVDILEGTLNLNNLSCVSVSTNVDGSSSPSCANLNFSLMIYGGTKENKSLFSVTVKAKKSGLASANISGVNILGNGVYLSSSSGAGSFNIEASCSCEDWKGWERGNCNEGGCVDKRVQVRNRSCHPAGCQEESQTMCVDDSLCASKPEPQTIINPPVNLAANHNKEDGSTSLSWGASSSSDISGYFILRKLSSDIYYNLIGTTTQHTLSYKDDSTSSSNNYHYVAVAFKGRSWDDSARSGFSNKATILIDKAKEKSKEKNTKGENRVKISVDKEGKTKSDYRWISKDKKIEIIIQKGLLVSKNGKILNKNINFLVEPAGEDGKLSEKDKNFFIDKTLYEIGAEEIQFSKDIEVIIKYDIDLIPKGKNESDIVLKFFDGKKWIPLPTEIDDEHNTATGKTNHFSVFGLFIDENSEAKLVPSVKGEEDVNDEISGVALFGILFSLISVLGLIIYYKAQRRNYSGFNLKPTRILEFLIAGILFGLIEGILAVHLIAGVEITWKMIFSIFLIALPFSVFSELVIDHPNFWKRLSKGREIKRKLNNL